MQYAEAFAAALRRCLTDDDRVVLLGIEYGGITPHQRHFSAIAADFPDRVTNPPWSELAKAGAGVGAALAGLRPAVDFVTASFMYHGLAQVINEAPNIRYISAGQTSCPVVFHVLGGIRRGGGAQHSHMPQAILWNTPGLQVVLPASPADVYGLARTALLDSSDPVVIVDHPLLFDLEGHVDLDAAPVPFGTARIVREGGDVTVVATSVMVGRAEAAADELSDAYGVQIEIIDPRTLVPLDEETIVTSVRKTGRLVVADESHASCGVGAELITRVVERCYSDLRAAPRRVSTPIPDPHSLQPSASEAGAAVGRVDRRGVPGNACSDATAMTAFS